MIIMVIDKIILLWLLGLKWNLCFWHILFANKDLFNLLEFKSIYLLFLPATEKWK